MGGLSLFSTFLTVVAVLLLAYWCSRQLGKQGMKTSGLRHMKVIEHIQVGQDRMILLVKVGEHTYLMGASQAGVQLLTEVEGSSIRTCCSRRTIEKCLPFRRFWKNV